MRTRFGSHLIWLLPLLFLAQGTVWALAPLQVLQGDNSRSVLEFTGGTEPAGGYLLIPEGAIPKVVDGPADRVILEGPQHVRQFCFWVVGVTEGAPCIVTIEHPSPSGQGGEFLSLNARPWPGTEWMAIIKDMALNWNHLQLPPPRMAPRTGTGGQLLIIVHSDFAGRIADYVNWKNDKGFKPVVVSTTETGTTALQIKNYITTAYTTWDIPPEYLLLIGDTDRWIPFPTSSGTDNYYVEMTGDLFVDIILGRVTCRTGTRYPNDPELVVNKVLGYETAPDTTLTTYYRRVAMAVNFDHDGSDAQYQACIDTVHNIVSAAGYPGFGIYTNDTGNSDDIRNEINAGISHFSYRGTGYNDFPYPFDGILSPYPSNRNKLVMVVGVTCGTGEYQSTDQVRWFNEEWLFGGTPAQPTGAIGYFGVTNSCPSCLLRRNLSTIGYFRAAFTLGLPSLGACAVSAKAYMYAARVAARAEYDGRTEYNDDQLLGDPTLWQWTGRPSRLTVTHPPAVDVGPITIPVTVTDGAGPVVGAWVCAHDTTGAYAWDTTGADGHCNLAIDLSAAGELTFTVTARNHLPYRTTITTTPHEPYPYMLSSRLIEERGNGDAYIEPGERWGLEMDLVNYGLDAPPPLGADLTVHGPLRVVAGHRDITAFPHLDTLALTGLSFEVDTSANMGDTVSLTVTVTWSGGSWSKTLADRTVSAIGFTLISDTLYDAPPGGNNNGLLDAGESGGLFLRLANGGPGTMTEGTLELTTTDPYLRILSAPIPLIYTGTTAYHRVPIVLSAHPAHAGGQVVNLTATVRGRTPTYNFVREIPFVLQIGNVAPEYPEGPDLMGYYCYEDADTMFEQAPVMDWLELAPPGPGTEVPRASEADADTCTLTLPFTFRYHGTNYTQVGVCSNGFLQVGRSTYRIGSSVTVPGDGVPINMIAPMWSDLDCVPGTPPEPDGEIYGYYDAANHRGIVEFKNVPPYEDTLTETFQVVFLDPAYHPTPTGDGEIWIQYQHFSNFTRFPWSVGIADQSGRDGLNYEYQRGGTRYHHGSAHGLESGRVLRYTTIPPTPRTRGWIVLDSVVILDGDGNHRIESGESFQLVTYLREVGGQGFPALEGTLLTLGAPFTVSDGTAPFGAMSALGGTSNATDPFALQAGDGADTLTAWLAQLRLVTSGDTIYLTVPLTLGSGSGVDDDLTVSGFMLEPIRPNPARGPVDVRFRAPTFSARVELVDVAGRVIECVDWYGVPGTPGQVRLDAESTPGMAWVRITSGKESLRRAVVFLR